MLGALAGDVIGSVYEGAASGKAGFSLFQETSRFTDDSVLTIATAEVLLDGGDYAETYARYFASYPNAGYGGMFHRWARSTNRASYNSYGNGSAMRVSPVGWWFDTLEETLDEAERSAVVTHNHSEAIRGAKAIAGAIFLARQACSVDDIRRFLEKDIGYDIPTSPYDATTQYFCDETCRESVPPALCAALSTDTVENAIRSAIWMGGDCDTIACMAGAVAEPLRNDLPQAVINEVYLRLTDDLREVVERFLQAVHS